MGSAQQTELPERISRKAYCCLAQEQTGCGTLNSGWGPENVLDALGCCCLIIQIPGIRQSVSPGLRCPWVPSGWVDPAECILTACCVPFHLHLRQMLEESEWSHSILVGCPVDAWHGMGRLVRNHWKQSNLGGIRFITQLLLPNVIFAQHSNWFQLTHSRALARESSRHKGPAVPTAENTVFQRSPTGRWAGKTAGRGDPSLRVTKRAGQSEEIQPDPCLSNMCGELTYLSREGTLIADILRGLQRQVVTRLILSY